MRIEPVCYGTESATYVIAKGLQAPEPPAQVLETLALIQELGRLGHRLPYLDEGRFRVEVGERCKCLVALDLQGDRACHAVRVETGKEETAPLRSLLSLPPRWSAFPGRARTTRAYRPGMRIS